MELFEGCPVKAHVIDDHDDDYMYTNEYYTRRREVRGVVTAIERDCVYVRGSDPEPMCIEPVKIKKQYGTWRDAAGDEHDAVATRTAVPIWVEPAGTVHAVQGQTKHDPHHVFTDGSWELGQIYVAASRATRPGLIHWVGDLLRLNTHRRYSSNDREWCRNGEVLVDTRILDFQAAIDARRRPWFGV